MKNESSNLFAGWEITSHEMKMRAKFFVELTLLMVSAQVILACLILYKLLSPTHVSIVIKYYFAKIAVMTFNNPMLTIENIGSFSAHQIVANTILREQIYGKVFNTCLLSVALSFIIWVTLPLVLSFLKKRADKEMKSKHLRGMQLITSGELKRELKDKPGTIPLGNLFLPSKYESEHIFIAGKSRVGKSVQIKQQVESIRLKKSRACIYDFKGEYVELFYRPETDFILNPLDARGVCWNIFNEIKTKADLSAVCDSLIPQSSGDDKFWSSAARDVFRGILAVLYQQNKKTNKDIWETVTSPIKEIAALLQSSPAGAAGFSYIQDASGKQAAGVIAVLMSYVSWLEFSQNEPQPGQPEFSTQSFLSSPGGFIFLTGRPEIEATLRPYTGLFVDLLGRRMLSLPDGENNPDQKTYFVLDEFGNLQKLPSIKKILTAAGSKGGCCIIGIQDFAAIVKIYGREDAETIYNSCGTNLILNVTDPATAKIFSERFGHFEYEYSQKNYRMSSSDDSDGTTVSKQEKEKSLILPSQIQSLPKLEGYLKIPEHNPALIQIEIKNYAPVCKSFIQAAGFNLDEVQDSQAATASRVAVAVVTSNTTTEEKKKETIEEAPELQRQEEEQLIEEVLF